MRAENHNWERKKRSVFGHIKWEEHSGIKGVMLHTGFENTVSTGYRVFTHNTVHMYAAYFFVAGAVLGMCAW